MPISHNSAPFPKPIVAPFTWQVNAVAPPRFLAGPMRRTGAGGAANGSVIGEALDEDLSPAKDSVTGSGATPREANASSSKRQIGRTPAVPAVNAP